MVKQLVFLIAISASGLVLANPKDMDESIDCSNPANGHEISQCQGRALNDEEFKMQQVIKQIFVAVKGTAAESLLRNSQQAWLRWRDIDAELCAQAEGWLPAGSGYGSAVANCRQSLTQARTRDLRGYLRKLKP